VNCTFQRWGLWIVVLLLAVGTQACSDEAPAPVEVGACPDFSQTPLTIDVLRNLPVDGGPLGTSVVTSETLAGVNFGRKFQITYPACADDETPEGYVIPAGPWPVIVFSHAQNDRQHEIYQVYDTLHRYWASWGYVVLSVDNAEENRKKVAKEGTAKENLQERSDWQRAGIDLLEALNADADGRFFDVFDLEKVIVAGHSRGGGASMLTARADARVRAMMLFQAIDPQSFGHGQVRVHVPSIGFTAGLDDDVKFPRADANEDLLRGPYVWVDILGGIHAYTTDTIPLRRKDKPTITRQEQLELTGLLSTLFLLAETRPSKVVFEGLPAESLPYSHLPEAMATQVAQPAVRTRWNRRPFGSILIDDFEFARVDESFLDGLSRRGDTYRWEGAGEARFVHTYGEYAPSPIHFLHRSKAVMLSVAGPEAGTLVVELVEPMQVGCNDRLKFRARSTTSLSGRTPQVEVGIRMGDKESVAPWIMGAAGLGLSYGQVAVEMGNLIGGCGGAVIDELFLRIADAEIVVDDLRLVVVP
jgi:dienelactone hydrolase